MEPNAAAKKTVKDPVCGKEVVPGGARSWDYLYQEMVYYFCGSECRSRFNANPEEALSGPGRPPPVAPPASFPEKSPSAFLKMLKKWRPRFL
jgi:YHS domain-containing protein